MGVLHIFLTASLYCSMSFLIKLWFVAKNYLSLKHRDKKKQWIAIQIFTLKSNIINLNHVSIYLLPVFNSKIWMHFDPLKTCFLIFNINHSFFSGLGYLMLAAYNCDCIAALRFYYLQQFFSENLVLFKAICIIFSWSLLVVLQKLQQWRRSLDINGIFSHNFNILLTVMWKYFFFYNCSLRIKSRF